MCLAIPGKVLQISEDSTGVRMAQTNFGGIVKQVCLEYTPEVQPGDYVLVHVGFALGKVDEEEARRTFELLEEMKQLNELETLEPSVENDDPERPEASLDAGPLIQPVGEGEPRMP